MCSISLSLSAGSIGALSTPVGTPAAASAAMVSRRRSGAAARGSMTRASLRSRVVTETVALAADKRRFGDDCYGMAKIAQHFEDRSGAAEPTFDRLIGVGVAAQRDRTTNVTLFAQFGGKQPRGLRLVKKPAFKIETR